MTISTIAVPPSMASRPGSMEAPACKLAAAGRTATAVLAAAALVESAGS